MPYTLGERIYGIRDDATLQGSPGFSQRMRDIYSPFQALNAAEQVYFVPEAATEDASFAPLAADVEGHLQEAGKGVLWFLGIGAVVVIWWMLSAGQKAPEETVSVPMPRRDGF
jgi:hypothetical protein